MTDASEEEVHVNKRLRKRKLNNTQEQEETKQDGPTRTRRFNLRPRKSTASEMDRVLTQIEERKHESNLKRLHRVGLSQLDKGATSDQEIPELDPISGGEEISDGEDGDKGTKKGIPRLLTKQRKEKDVIAETDSDDDFIAPENEEEETNEEVKLDIYRMEQEETLLDTKSLSSTSLLLPTHSRKEAFRIFVQYFTSILVDINWQTWVHKEDLKARELILPSVEIMDSWLREKREKWLYSTVWEKNPIFKNALESRPIMVSNRDWTSNQPSSDDDVEEEWNVNEKCQACSRERHTSWNVTLQGLAYDATTLKYPFHPEMIVERCRQVDPVHFKLGLQCHSRVKLYHSLFHFKLRFLLALKEKINIITASSNAREEKLIEVVMSDGMWIDGQYNALQTLNEIADKYRKSSRFLKLDVDQLDDLSALPLLTLAELFPLEV